MPNDNHDNNGHNPDEPINGASISNIRETDSVEITNTNNITGRFSNSSEDAFIAPDGAVESRKTKHRHLHNGVPFDPNTYIGLTHSGLVIHEGADYRQCTSRLHDVFNRERSKIFFPGQDGAAANSDHGDECTRCRQIRQCLSWVVFILCIWAILGLFTGLWEI